MTESEKNVIIERTLKRREKARIYMQQYRKDHPDRVKASSTYSCIKRLKKLGYTIIPPKGDNNETHN